MPTTSGNYNYYTTRDSIIMRALRIVGAIGQGELAINNATAITEAAEALNDLCKEWQADGMPLWKVTWCAPITMIASQAYLNIGLTGASNTSCNQPAPLKILQAYLRNTTTNFDNPMLLVSQQEYTMMSNKASLGQSNQLFYQTPGATVVQMTGKIYLYPTPDTTSVAANTLNFLAQYPFANFDVANDVPDFPSYWNNAIKWGLADQLSFEYGVGLSERGMIQTKADKHKQIALSYGTEEGSLYFQPDDA